MILRALAAAALVAGFAIQANGESATPPHGRQVERLLGLYRSLGAAEEREAPAQLKSELAAALLASAVPNSHSLAKVVKLLHEAGEEGDGKANYLLGVLYRSGFRNNKDPELAAQLVAAGVEADLKAGTIPVLAMECGALVKPEMVERLAANMDRFNPREHYRVAWCHFAPPGASGNPDKGVPFLIAAAQGGEPLAQFVLGMFYEQGKHVPQSMDQAAEWYRRAYRDTGKGQHVEAGYRLALLGLTDKISMSRMELNKLLLDLVGKGHVESKLVLAQLAFSEPIEGVGDEKLLSLANDVMAAGYGLGYLIVAVCYEHGRGTPRNPQKAVELYDKAGQTGLAIAYARLGDMLAMGLDVERDPKRAIAAYGKAKDLGYDAVKQNLAALEKELEGEAGKKSESTPK